MLGRPTLSTMGSWLTRHRPQRWREPELSTARTGGSPRLGRRRQDLLVVGEAAPWHGAAGSVGDGGHRGPCISAGALGGWAAGDTEQGILPGVAVGWELTWVFSALGFPFRLS